ncbi:hypothetical protein [Niallia taxi]|uniref:hypothetical protein n=1 Tax=Niallia taxi TaxID=2499688 RepID=UPI0015F6D95C|nr:hypothetical protein [Niallia taxi]
MHRGDEVFITKSGKYYHYFDDDCPTSSSILKGKRQAQRIKEDEAKARGYSLCRHCAKEYNEDLRERGLRRNANGEIERAGCGAAILLFGLGAGVIFAVSSYLI